MAALTSKKLDTIHRMLASVTWCSCNRFQPNSIRSTNHNLLNMYAKSVINSVTYDESPALAVILEFMAHCVRPKKAINVKKSEKALQYPKIGFQTHRVHQILNAHPHIGTRSVKV